MKKILIVAATAGLMSLAACQPTANNTTVDTGNEANAASYETTNVTTETTNVDTAVPADANATTTTTTNTTTTGNAM